MQVFIKKLSPLLFTTVVVSSCGNNIPQQAAPAPVKVSVFKTGTAPVTRQLTYAGNIEPDNTAQIGFAVSGVVNEVAVQEGQHVQTGQLLAAIDATEYTNALAIANAGLEQAEDMYSRLNQLYQKGSLPAKDYIDIKTKVAQARANKSINAKHIEDSRLYAPMQGIVTAKLVERGSMAAPGVPAFTIIKTDEVYAKFTVPESEIGLLKPGLPAAIYIPTLNDSVKGTISIINPQADATSKTYSVKIKLNNQAQRLLPGMLANIFINTGKTADAITVPAAAIVRDADDITYAFVANAGKATKKRVTTGRLIGDNSVIITAGLQKGDDVITAGQTHLKDGSAIAF